MITLIDNYDSFTYNLYHDLMLKDDVMIIKNDQIIKNFKRIIKSKAVVISPGPSNPFN
jgi:anthranilate/para-aminobenzoate synthase component II